MAVSAALRAAHAASLLPQAYRLTRDEFERHYQAMPHIK